MFKSYLKIVFKELTSNRIFSIIHVIGLSTGIAAFVIILQYALYELSYDRFYKNVDQIYRIRLDRYNKGVLSTTWGAGCAAIGPAVKREFPEVLKVGILRGINSVISINNTAFMGDKIFAANTSFLTMMPVSMVCGTDSTALNEPFNAVISESDAMKFFGTADVLGRTFTLDDIDVFTITGVFRDIPANTHIKFNILISWPTIVKYSGNRIETAWNADGFYTYVMLAEGTDVAAFEKKMNDFGKKQNEEHSLQYNQSEEYYLQPFSSIHLHSHLMWEAEVNGNAETVYFLIVIASIILIIAWVNYINLSTVKAVFRSKEIAVRKISGASRLRLIKQFISESFALNLISSVLAMFIVAVSIPFFRSLTGREIGLNTPDVWIIFLSVILFGPLFTGLYPALVTSSFKPMNIFRGGAEGISGSAVIRKVLIVFQFTASVILVAGTITVYRQVKYMRNQDVGASIEKTLILRGPSVVDSTFTQKMSSFKSELLKNPFIKSVSASTCVPGNKVSWNAGGIRRLSDDDTKGNQYRIIGVDNDFIDSYQLSVIAGRAFSKEFGSEEQSVMFNEEAVKLMGFETIESALAESIFFWGQTYKIIGVLKNYHQESLKETFDALIFRFTPQTHDFFSVKLNYSGQTEYWELRDDLVDIMKENWEKFFPGNPFDFFPLEDHYNNQYRAENQIMIIFELFAALAILIACLGLFGLSWFIIARRTKETGIRKVHGASFADIILLFSKDFFTLVFSGIIIAAPITYLLSVRWMEKFACQAGFSWWIFLLSGLLILFISALAISYNVVLITRTNPASSLKEN